MSCPVLAFVGGQLGAGSSNLAYHLAWMLEELRVRVLAVDLDPQAVLSHSFVDEDELEALWQDPDSTTIHATVAPLLAGQGEIRPPAARSLTDRLALLVGDPRVALLDEDLADAWTHAVDGNARALGALSALWRVIQAAAGQEQADLVIIDLPPNLGAVNRAALLGATHLATPVAAGPVSLIGLGSLGARRRQWAQQWRARLAAALGDLADDRPAGSPTPVGYILTQHGERVGRPVRAYLRWADQIPGEYRRRVLDQPPEAVPVAEDPHCLATIKHHRSLIPMAQEARKPVFRLLPADGALGSHAKLAHDTWFVYADLARKLAARCGVTIPD